MKVEIGISSSVWLEQSSQGPAIAQRGRFSGATTASATVQLRNVEREILLPT